MQSYQVILDQIPAFVVVLSRVSGLFFAAPVLSSSMIPRQHRTLLALMMSLGMLSVIDQPHTLVLGPDLASLFPVLAGEMLIGVVIGIIALIPLAAVQLAGLVMGQQMGMGLAHVINPAIDIEGNDIGQLLFMGALTGFLSLGGLDLMFSSVAETFHRVPPGAAMITIAPLDLITGLLASSFVLAMRVSLPVLAILLLESIASGVIMKTVPSINIMTVGFPIRVVVGMLVLLASLTVVHATILDEVRHGLDVLLEWSRTVELSAK